MAEVGTIQLSRRIKKYNSLEMDTARPEKVTYSNAPE